MHSSASRLSSSKSAAILAGKLMKKKINSDEEDMIDKIKLSSAVGRTATCEGDCSVFVQNPSF